MALFLCTLLLTLSRQELPVGEPTQNLGPHHFSVAKGHQISLALKPGLVDRPISAAFDSQGRLYVTESSGSNEPAAQQAQKKPHRILQLSDSDGDGVFDKRTVFADNLMLPQGIMVFRGEVWVGTPPQIWRLLDTNDDGVADKRTLFHDGGTLTGCMNDLHGPALGPDGRIYWTKGAFAEQKHTIDGKPFVTKACHVFSARPNGSDLQVHMTGGMDNPVGVAFSPLGDLFVSCTFVHHPHLGLRDGIIHPTLGMVFGKDHAPI
ncbi:MAG: PVC-type heme-binding CxxCH protein, partial [Gemmataceae bacterium]